MMPYVIVTGVALLFVGIVIVAVRLCRVFTPSEFNDV